MEVPSVSLGKNFRLPTDCKPVRYSAHLAPDLAKGAFEGRMELEVRLQAPRREIHLHGIGLDVKRARARVQDRAFKAAIAADAESETITLRFDEELPPGNAMLDLAWSGNFSPGLRGLYRAGPLAVTQFEAADARRVFPCFDEPAFKARWNLQLVGLPDGLTALSNGAVIKDQKEPGGGRTVQFAETAPLSSYLVVFCIGELASSPEKKARAYPVRTWAVPQKQALTAFGQEVACAVLPLLEDYFGQPYAYGKVDQVGVPDFEAGAMENAACITYREVALLLDPKTAPLNVQKRVAEVITHEKGGAILRMIEGYLGEEKFREGIRLYMRRHREANATADDLWGALAEASGQPILELANGWIRQTGYPLVTLGLQEGKIRIAQRRFFSDPQATPEPTQWLVPLVLRIDGRERRVLLQSQEETLDPGGKPGWVLGNAGARGFYRTAYDPELLRRLVAALRELRPEERMALVSDQWALVRANAVKLEGFLHLLAGLRSEEDHTVLDEVVGRMGYLEHRGVSDADRPAFQAWVRGLFAGPGADLGWNPAPAEDDERRLRRAALLRALVLVARDPAEVARATERFREHLQHPLALDPNLLDIVVAAAARDADEKRFEELRERARTELDPAAKRRYLHALAMVEDPRLVDRAVALALDPLVQMQDFSSYLGTLLGNRAGREPAWRLVQTRWDEVRAKADSPMIMRRLVEALGNLPEPRHLEEVEKFLASHELPPAKQAVAQTLERLRADVALRERLLPEVAAFLRGPRS